MNDHYTYLLVGLYKLESSIGMLQSAWAIIYSIVMMSAHADLIMHAHVLDVNECDESPCEQRCNNTEGSYECSCGDGYEITDEGSCDSKYCMQL